MVSPPGAAVVGEDDVFLFLLAPPPDDDDGLRILGGRGDSELRRSEYALFHHEVVCTQ